MTTILSEWRPIASLLVAVLLWASSFIALKLAFRAYDPMLVIFGRMAVAACCFLLIFRGVKPAAIRKKDLKLILFMTLCEPCLYFLFEAQALKNTTATQAGMITALLPLLVALCAGLVLKERVGGRTYFGFAVAIAGVCWLSLGAEPSFDAPRPLLGNFLEFSAMVCATGYTVSLKRLSARYHPFFLAALQSFIGSFFYLPLLFMGPPLGSLKIEVVPLSSILYLGVFVTLGAYGAYNYGVSRMPASQASAFVNLIPVFALILGWIVLAERFTPMQYPASALVFIGVFISQQRKSPRRLAPPKTIDPGGS